MLRSIGKRSCESGEEKSGEDKEGYGGERFAEKEGF